MLLVLQLFSLLFLSQASTEELLAHLQANELANFFNDRFTGDSWDKSGLVSAAISVIAKNGTRLFAGAYGNQDPNPEPQLPTKLDTIFNLGGIASLFVSTVAMQYAEKYGLDLDTPVDTLFELAKMRTLIGNFTIGDPHNYAGYPVFLDQPGVTILQLLQHVGGLDGAATRGQITNLKLRRELDNYMAFYGPRRIRTANELPVWNNHGISYAALAIEAFVNRSNSVPKVIGGRNFYIDILNRSLLRPMGLNNTFGLFTEALRDNPKLQQFPADSGPGEHAARQFYPARDMYGDLKDLEDFALMHMNGGVNIRDGKRVLSEQATLDMQDKYIFPPLDPKFHPILGSFGVGLGWQKGKHGNITYIDSGSASTYWKNNIRLYREQGLIVITLALSASSTKAPYTPGVSPDRFLRRVSSDFAQQFVVPQPNCLPPGYPWKHAYGDCVVNQSYFSGYPQPDRKELQKYVGGYIIVDYPHTTWEKIDVYRTLYFRKNQTFQLCLTPSGTLRDNRDGCYAKFATEVFYRGLLEKNGDCLFVYPMQTTFIIGFRYDQDNVSTLPEILISGGLGGALPYERMTPILTLDWDVIFFFYIGFYTTSFIGISATGFFIIKRKSDHQKDGNFIAYVFGTIAVICSTLCNIVSIVGMYYVTGIDVLDERYTLPILFTSLGLLGFVFWFLELATFLYLMSKKAYYFPPPRHQTIHKLEGLDGLAIFWLVILFLNCLMSLAVIFVFLQWNLFGPGHVV